MNIGVWIKAFRLRTLPLALSSILMGAFLAANKGVFSWIIFWLCISTTVFLQILSNLSNDYGDSIHGADHSGRKGPSRMVQSGLVTSSEMRGAMLMFVLLSLTSGIALLLVSFGTDWKAILFFLALGLLSIGAAIAYTVGKKPYGYSGLGDISVLIFFGVVGVLGSYYLFTKSLSWIEVLPAISCGLFSVAVLNINNIRDITSDISAGKYSVPVRIGREKAVIYHHTLLIIGWITGIAFTAFTFNSTWQLLYFLSAPLFVLNALAVSRKSSEALDPYLRQMALSTLTFVILFGTGLLLS